ncbi:hypoxanthine phosphoribosyltransferase [Hyphomonas beringensis]|uniref:Hypoxanthine phosphoribosyltransferase n=1 Tax=Hyphomonas beringensis TaxID=1280946 RepID=A0A062U2T8_9PROT|nr:phosphoribosyltransferase family protein [Hyphomonas beringensis]KCZ50944.1 hypoxanthine phosphoribosyltransferase [Hyphomonas beringensis]
MSETPQIEVVVPEEELMAHIDKMAQTLAPRLTGEWTIVSILIGATPFTSDLMKALARRDIHPTLDVIWLESYRDARESSGRVVVRADLTRSVTDRGVLILDDVFDTGRTLAFARQHMLAKGAREVITCALTQKPWAPRGEDGVDYCAIEAPGRYLVGYGMDDAGKYRGLPYIGALD